MTTASGSGAKRTTWQRDRMVGSCRSGLVPTRTISERGGGSSSVLRKALADSSLKSSASSSTATLPRPRADFREKAAAARASASIGHSCLSGGSPAWK